MGKSRSNRKGKSKKGGRRRSKNSLSGVVAKTTHRTPLGRKFKQTLRYNEPTVSINPGAGTLGTFVFRGNSIFDPSFTGVGHQPLGFDEMTPFYDHYTVIGAVLRATFYNTDATAAQIVGIGISDDTTTTASDQVFIENGTNQFTTLGPAGSSRDTITMTYKLNPNKFLGISHPLSSENVRGSATTNPSEQCYFHVVAGSTGAADPSNVLVNVTIDYTVIWTEPKRVSLS